MQGHITYSYRLAILHIATDLGYIAAIDIAADAGSLSTMSAVAAVFDATTCATRCCRCMLSLMSTRLARA
jgi:hypothetical protein